MKGKYYIELNNPILELYYKLVIKRKITILQGNSGTGKTLFGEAVNVEDFTKVIYIDNNGNKVRTDTPIIRLTLNQITNNTDIHDSIIVFDEDDLYNSNNINININSVVKFIKNTNNYFILITRQDDLDSIDTLIGKPVLPYSCEEIFEFKSYKDIIANTRYTVDIANLYNNIHTSTLHSLCINNADTLIIVEDSGFGYKFYKKLFNNCNVMSASGRDKIIKFIKDNDILINNYKNIVVIVDGAAIGKTLNDLKYYGENTNNHFIILLSESFEFLLLSSIDKYNNKLDLADLLAHTYDFLDVTVTDCVDNRFKNNMFGSWEIFYFNRLKELTWFNSIEFYKYDKNPKKSNIIKAYYDTLNSYFCNIKIRYLEYNKPNELTTGFF